jgi:hypothetical protein
MSPDPLQEASGAAGDVSAEAVIRAQPYRAGQRDVLSHGRPHPLRYMALRSAFLTGTPSPAEPPESPGETTQMWWCHCVEGEPPHARQSPTAARPSLWWPQIPGVNMRGA